MEINYYSFVLILIAYSFQIVLTLTGIVLNIIFLVVFIKHSEIRTPENVMLINLCIGDLAYVLSFLFPMSNGVFEFSTVLCYFFTFCRSFAMALSTSSVATISIQRYLGLMTFTNRLAVDRKDYRRSLLMLAGVWMLAVVLAATEVLLISFDVRNCEEYSVTGEGDYRVVAYGLIPSVITAGFCIAAYRRINQSARRLPSEQCAASARLRDRRRKSARILFALAVVFAFTYLPFSMCVSLLKQQLLKIDKWLLSLIFLTAFLMSMLNPIFNPIAMIIASRQLRELYKECCCCCCSGSNRAPSSAATEPQGSLVDY